MMRRVALWAVVAVFASPLVLLVLGSLGTPGAPPPRGLIDLFPGVVDADTYRAAWSIVPLRRQLLNSLLVVAISVPITVLVASGSGFALAMGSRTLRRTLIVVTVAMALVPPVVLWVPRVVLLRWLGLGGETLSVTATALAATSPLLVLLYALAYLRLPKSPLDAARCEGLTPVALWWKAAMPQVPGTTFAVAALAAVAHWANVVEPLLLLTDPNRQTAAIGIRTLGTLEPALFPVFLAGAVIVTLPPVAIFLLVQRRLFSALGSELPPRVAS